MRTKKVGSTGRLGVGYGKKVRERILKVEREQRKKQSCPYCNKKTVKRVSKGLWQCKACKKKFTSSTYSVANI